MSSSAVENADNLILPAIKNLSPREVAELGVLLIATAATLAREASGNSEATDILSEAYDDVAGLYVSARKMP